MAARAEPMVPIGTVGAAGTMTWEVTAIGAGSTTLKLEENRSWEPDSTITTFEVTIGVN